MHCYWKKCVLEWEGEAKRETHRDREREGGRGRGRGITVNCLQIAIIPAALATHPAHTHTQTHTHRQLINCYMCPFHCSDAWRLHWSGYSCSSSSQPDRKTHTCQSHSSATTRTCQSHSPHWKKGKKDKSAKIASLLYGFASLFRIVIHIWGFQHNYIVVVQMCDIVQQIWNSLLSTLVLSFTLCVCVCVSVCVCVCVCVWHL